MLKLHLLEIGICSSFQQWRQQYQVSNKTRVFDRVHRLHETKRLKIYFRESRGMQLETFKVEGQLGIFNQCRFRTERTKRVYKVLGDLSGRAMEVSSIRRFERV